MVHALKVAIDWGEMAGTLVAIIHTHHSKEGEKRHTHIQVCPMNKQTNLQNQYIKVDKINYSWSGAEAESYPKYTTLLNGATNFQFFIIIILF